MGTVELDGEVLSIRERRKRSFAVMQDVNRQLFASSLVDEMLLSVGHRSSVNAEEIEMVLASLGLGEMGKGTLSACLAVSGSGWPLLQRK